MMAVGTTDGSVCFISPKHGVIRRIVTGWATSLALDPKSKTLAVGGGIGPEGPGSVQMWDIQTFEKITTFEHPDLVKGVAFSPDGQTLAVGGHKEGENIYLWDLKAGKATQKLAGSAPCAFNSDGRILAMLGWKEKGEIRVFDTSKKELTAFEHGYRVSPLSIVFHPKENILAIGGNADEPTITLWEIPLGREIRRFTDAKVPIKSLSFSPDGSVLAFGGWRIDYSRKDDK
jgi:WD40 repeat protein